MGKDKGMIIAGLVGGLGNQLFQYAAARYLAEINNVALKVDLSEYEDYSLHKYSLHHYNIIENIATKEDVCAVEYVKEKHYHYDNGFVNYGKNVLLRGYWQTDKYFADISDIIRNEFQVKSVLSGKNAFVAEQIERTMSVALHIRRTDYMPSTYTDQILDVLGLDYYRRALSILSQHERDINVFVFSDDPEWVKDNLVIEYPTVYVDHNNSDANYEDLRLMSMCKHNIIANSSFSWWGAWLNTYENKKVYCPDPWFNSNVRNINSKDLIPETWIKLPI
jgi:hypothetical protein